jgi:hypothetical protein
MDHAEFVAGTYDTGFIERNKSALLNGKALVDDGLLVGAALHRALAEQRARAVVSGSSSGVSPWRQRSIGKFRS